MSLIDGWPSSPHHAMSCRYSPDVGNLTDDALAAHYLGAGRKGHHVAQRLRVVMSYQVCSKKTLAWFGSADSCFAAPKAESRAINVLVFLQDES